MSARRFTLIQKLGEGTFGAVYLADYETSGGFRRRCAIKLLHPTWDPESDAVVRLRDEARLLGRLQHPNIVRVDDLLQLAGRWAVVMEAIHGENLEQLIARRAETRELLPLSVVCGTLLGIASAIRAAATMHDDAGRPAAVVHRDVKPSNVLLAENGTVKVLDFGVAKAAFDGREARTGQHVYGSLGYMAPERILGESESTAGDVYAIAAVGCEMLLLESLGRCPLTGAAHEREMARVMGEIETTAGEASRRLRELLRSMMLFTPGARPGVEEVQARLVELTRAAPGPPLDDWAPADLRPRSLGDPDPVAGTVLLEGSLPDLPPPTDTPVPIGLPLAPAPPPSDSTTTAGRALDLPAGPSPRRGSWGLAMGAGALGLVGLAGWLATREGPAAVVGERAAATGAPASTVAEPPAPSSPAPLIAETPKPAPPSSDGVADAASAAPVRKKAGAARRPEPAPPPVVVPPTPSEPEAAPPPAPRLRSVKVTLDEGGPLGVRCGDVAQQGLGDVLLRNVPAGECEVTASGITGRFSVNVSGGIACSIEGGSLACR